MPPCCGPAVGSIAQSLMLGKYFHLGAFLPPVLSLVRRSPPPKRSPPDEVVGDPWFSAGRFSWLLGFLIIASFPQVIFGTETFYFSDFSGYGFPLAHYTRQSFWHGCLPLWNPLSCCGLPFLAQWNTQTLYPPSIFYFILPLSWALGAYCLLHLFFAGLGMFFLARHLSRNGLAASLAGLVFAFNGITWQSLMWPAGICSLAWMPWVVLCAELAWQRGGRWLMLAAGVGAMQILSGTPEVIILTGVIAGTFWIVRLMSPPAPRPRLIIRGLIVAGIVAGLSAPQLFPFIDLLARSQRNSGYGSAMNSMAPSALANFLLPLFNCYQSAVGGYVFQNGQNYFSSFFVGLATLAFVLIGVVKIRTRAVWILTFLTVWSLALAMGSNSEIYALLRQAVPALGLMRYPVKFVMMTTFTLPLLAACGLGWFRVCQARDHVAALKLLLVMGGSLCAVGMVALFIAGRHPDPSLGFSAILANSFARCVFLILICGCIGALGRAGNVAGQRWLKCAFLLLVWLDLFKHITPLAPAVNRHVYDIKPSARSSALPVDLPLGQKRALVVESSSMPRPGDESAAAYVRARRFASAGNLNLLDQVPKADGFFPLEISEMADIDSFLNLATDGPSPLEDFLGIADLFNSEASAEWRSRRSGLPLITIGQQPVYVTASNAYWRVTQSDFDSRQLVFLPLAAQSQTLATRSTNSAVLSFQVSAQAITADVQSDRPAMVVIAQAYYHNWKACVDGRPVPLWRANYAFQALEVPPGRHRVGLVYDDQCFVWGCVIALLTLVGGAGRVFLGWRRLPAAVFPVSPGSRPALRRKGCP